MYQYNSRLGVCPLSPIYWQKKTFAQTGNAREGALGQKVWVKDYGDTYMLICEEQKLTSVGRRNIFLQVYENI